MVRNLLNFPCKLYQLNKKELKMNFRILTITQGNKKWYEVKVTKVANGELIGVYTFTSKAKVLQLIKQVYFN